MVEPNAGELLQRRNGCRLREFDPSSYEWDEWEILLDTYLTVEGITDGDKKRNLLITALGVQPFKTLISVCKPRKPTECTYDEIVLKLRTNYARVTFASTERIKFFSMKQSSSQSLTDFANQLRTNSTTCKFPGDFYEEALITAFVGGLLNSTVRKHLMQQELETFEKTLNIANTINSVLVQGANVERSTSESEDNLINKIQAGSPKTTKSDQKSCFSCGGKDHLRSSCRFKDVECHKCHKQGHIAKVCRSKPNVNPIEVNTIASLSSSEIQMEPAILISLSIEEINVQFQLDTGSPITVVCSRVWEQLGQPQLQQVRVLYHSFSGHPIRFKGETMVNANYQGEKFRLKVLVGYNNQTNIVGRDWINSLKLMNHRLSNIIDNPGVFNVDSSTTELNKLLDEYQDIFKQELGRCKIQAHLDLKPDTMPKFCKTRSLPFAYKEAVEEELTRFVKEGVLEQISFSKWATPIVVVPKPNGKVRVCADFSTGVNKALNIDKYPLPKPNDLFVTLNGGTIFTKIDLTEAYLQVEMDESSKEILVINTHKGLFRYNRLPFGIASAPSIFQNIMDQMLVGVEGTVCYLDDIIVTGKTPMDHLKNLKCVFNRIQEYGFRINQKKCSFLKPSVEYLGFVVDVNGVHSSSDKTKAITDMPKPINVSQLRSFLGMVNHYSKFIPRLASRLSPFYKLLKQGVSWQWDSACDKAFYGIKDCLTSPLALTHYDPTIPLVLATDASMSGLGAVIYHRFPNGSEKVISYASKTLTATETRYSQIEKEALAIMYGVQKFDQFLRGRHFILLTDHKPLTTIFGSKRGIPTTSANRLQRWAIRLMAYTYDIEYCSTKNFGQADGLSRLPMGPDTKFDEADVGEGGLIAQIQQELQDELPLRAADIAKATRKDSILSSVYQYILSGWPVKVPDEYYSYYKIRHELSIAHGCITWGLRTIIPICFRSRLLQHLHLTHFGMGRMKAEARHYFWWPLLDKDIENMARNCISCTENSKQVAKVPLNQWEIPEQPWQRIHIDFMGRFMGFYFLIVVDAHSKWLEVITMKQITTTLTIDALSSLFSRYGLCNVIVSDNGAQFTSKEFNDFCDRSGIRHIRTAPAHAQSNGQAERYVDIVKSALTKTMRDGGKLHDALLKILFSYRTTPHSTTGTTPAELFLKRPLRTVLDLLRPTTADMTKMARQRYERNFNRHTKERYFNQGEKVLVRDFRNSSNKVQWTPGTLIQRQGLRLWTVKVEDKIWRRHENQIKPRRWSSNDDDDGDKVIISGTPSSMDTTGEDQDTSISTPTSISTAESASLSSEEESPILRRSTRIRQPVRRYIEEI